MATDLEQLEKLATAAEEKASAARAKIEEENERRLAARLERERELDEQLVATAPEERDRLAAESRQAYDAMIAALEETPIVQTIARFRAAKANEWQYYAEIQNAATRLGQPPSSYEPERREIAFVDSLNDAIRRATSDLTTQAEEARAAEREAYLSEGDAAA